ncbi:phosphoribosylamine--glycine ligase [Candidatus Thorarchaeota archaeon]|nr:MAG: phosphoribosylamine--glycine ligase [Candidatus Thorarchaeota archaeon]
MTTVLLVGSGAREHAIALALSRSGVDIRAHMHRNNPGIASLAAKTTIGDITDYRSLSDISGVDYAIIGPESPIERGLANYLERHDVPCVAPRQEAARIETSKSFARRVLDKVASDANPRYKIVNSIDEMREFERELNLEDLVVKPDGLTGGKGVKIYSEHFSSRDQLEDYAITHLKQRGVVLLEERLEGTEFTVQCFVDGNKLEPMPLVRDYKRAYDSDSGSNTGSMGAYSCPDHGLNFVSGNDMAKALEIMKSTVEGVRKQTTYKYKGILYGQFMKTNGGLKVIEFNARFGDPEAINVLSILDCSLDEICQGIILGDVPEPQFLNKATVCVYVVPDGYPGPSATSDSPITIGDEISSILHYASVYEEQGKVFTTSSRSLAVCGVGDTISEARQMAYNDIRKVSGNIRYRSDIAQGVE